VSASTQSAGDAADDSGDSGGTVSGGLVTGSLDGGSVLGTAVDGAVDVCGQGVEPSSAPGEEAQADEDDGVDGGVAVDALTEGEGFAGGCVLRS
jgi:hypothetical protein